VTAPGPQRPPLRLVAAVAAGKCAASASRLLGRGGGTSLPGMIARRIYPGVLHDLAGKPGIPAVAITGSNGKTTTARFTAALLRGEGQSVVHNAAGANLQQGVTTLAVNSASFGAKLRTDVFLAEIDEGALVQVAPEIRPRVLAILDIFRDQLDRFGEIYAVARAIESVAEQLPPDATLVVNADDPLVARMVEDGRGKRITFGFDVPQSFDRITSAADTIRCPRCRVDLHYDHVYLSHLGAYRCDNCGLARPPLHVAVTDVAVDGLEATTCTIRTPDGPIALRIPQPGVHVAYNAAAAIAICWALGIKVPHAAESLASVRTAFGRMQVIDADGREIVLAFAKNPTSFNAMLRTLGAVGEPRHLLTSFSNTLIDGEDFGWLWDVDFESAAPQLDRVTVCGLRSDELATRLKYAGVDAKQIVVVDDQKQALDDALEALPPGQRLSVISGYTPTIQFSEQMRRRGWVERYWKQ
jgi:lipid II isoglutaminyl synthase (glutamine-hydrolysing)